MCRNDGDLKLSRPCVASGFQSWLPGKRALARSRWRPPRGSPVGVGVKIFEMFGAMSKDSKYWLGRHVSRMTPPSERVVESASGNSSALAGATWLPTGGCVVVARALRLGAAVLPLTGARWLASRRT